MRRWTFEGGGASVGVSIRRASTKGGNQMDSKK